MRLWGWNIGLQPFSTSFKVRVKWANQHYCVGMALEVMSSWLSPRTLRMLVRLGGDLFEEISKKRKPEIQTTEEVCKNVLHSIPTPALFWSLREWRYLLRLRRKLFQVTVLGALDFMEKETLSIPEDCFSTPLKYPGAAFSLECDVMLIFTSLDELNLPKALSDSICSKVYCQKVGRARTLQSLIYNR